MQAAPPKPCSSQPCPHFAEYRGRCRDHANQADATRGSAYERGYDKHWQQLRRHKLSIARFCELRIKCKGLIATEVHHVIPIRVRPDLRLDLANLQSACKRCHSTITRREQQR